MVLRSELSLDKVHLVSKETVKAKPTVNGSVFITYSNTIYVYGISLYISCYLITICF